MGIMSIVFAFLLMVSLKGVVNQSGLVIFVAVLAIALGLIIPVWMFIRSILLLFKRQNLGSTKNILGFFLTIFLGFILLFLFSALVLFVKEELGSSPF